MVPQEMLTDNRRGPPWLLQTALRGRAYGRGAATKGLARSQGTAQGSPNEGEVNTGLGVCMRRHQRVGTWSKRCRTRAVANPRRCHEGERKHSTMPQGNPTKGMMATLKGFYPGILEENRPGRRSSSRRGLARPTRARRWASTPVTKHTWLLEKSVR